MDNSSAKNRSDERVPTRHVSSARHTVNIFAARLMTLPLTILTSILVIRVLGPTSQGIYGFLLLFGAVALPILMFGFGASVTYFVSSKRFTPSDVFCTAIYIGAIQGALAAVLIGMLWYCELLGETARETPASLIVPVLFVLPIQGASLYATRVALGDSWFALSNRVTLATPLLTAVTLLTLVVVLRLGVHGAVVGMLATNVLILSGIFVASARRYRPSLALNTAFMREGWRYGLKAWIADVVGLSNLRLDQWVLGMIAAPDVLGIYRPAVVISELPSMLPDSLSFVLFNKIAGARGEDERRELVERSHRVVFWTMAVGCALVAAASPLVAFVYGSAYAASALPLALLMPGAATFCIHKVLTKYFAGTGSPHHAGTTSTVGALVGFALYAALIPRFGAVGAAIAHTGCHTATGLTALIIYRSMVAPRRPRLFRLGFSDLRWVREQARTIINAGKHAPACGPTATSRAQ
jgi:O-antigen/teichoic acid export membrane protein